MNERHPQYFQYWHLQVMNWKVCPPPIWTWLAAKKDRLTARAGRSAIVLIIITLTHTLCTHGSLCVRARAALRAPRRAGVRRSAERRRCGLPGARPAEYATADCQRERKSANSLFRSVTPSGVPRLCQPDSSRALPVIYLVNPSICFDSYLVLTHSHLFCY
jgi:hypothetical protein